MTETMWTAVDAATEWLDKANGTDDHEVTMRILKLTEEAGEVAAAWTGATGGNPRKGVTHTRAEVAAELADVAVSALVAIASLGIDPRQTMTECAEKVAARLITRSDDPGGGPAYDPE